MKQNFTNQLYIEEEQKETFLYKIMEYKKYLLYVVGGIILLFVIIGNSYSSEDKKLIESKDNIKKYQEKLDSNNKENKQLEELIKCNKERLHNIVNSREYKECNKFDIIGLFIPRTYAEESLDDILDKKIVKFCKIYGKDYSKKLQNRCIKLGQAQLRFEVKSCSLKTWNNNCYNFRSISKKNREGFKFKTPLLDKAGFTQFESKTESIKFYAFRFFKYDYKKSVRSIVQDFTHSKEHRDNYTNYIFDYKPTF